MTAKDHEFYGLVEVQKPFFKQADVGTCYIVQNFMLSIVTGKKISFVKNVIKYFAQFSTQSTIKG